MKIGLSVRAVGELKKIFFSMEKRTPKLSRVRGGGILKGRITKLGTFCWPLDVMNHAKFNLYLISSLRAGGWSK
jgi:hypothetical protein